MTLPESQSPYQVVVFTSRHSLTGELTLKEKRLSDYLNERTDSAIHLRNVTISRLDEPAKTLHKLKSVTIPKTGILLVFEPPQIMPPPSHRFYSFTEKVKIEVVLAMDDMEISGILHTSGTMDVRRTLMVAADSFLPITEATVVLGADHNLVVREDTVLVNSQRVRFMGQVQPAALPVEKPPLTGTNPPIPQ